VYHALVAAADLFALRNHYSDGFWFDTAWAMYRAYETDLYKFDQVYRYFCESADRVESEGFDVLNRLREQFEAVYVHGCITKQALA
jgi:hypothetical protein